MNLKRNAVTAVALLCACLFLVSGCGPDKEVQAVVDSINSIGEVTVESADSIKAAEDAYNALTDEQKKSVSNYDLLTAAEEQFGSVRAKAVERAIDDLGEVTLEKEKQVSDARAAYKELGEYADLVTNVDVLNEAEGTLDTLKEEKKAADEQERLRSITVNPGETVSTDLWSVTLTSAYVSNVLESSESRTSWQANDGGAFLILEFDVEALTSDKKAVDSSALTDIKATYRNNTYGDWDMKYLSGELWLSMERTYLDANVPAHVYVYTILPESASSSDDSISVDLKIGGLGKHIVVR